MLSAENLHLKLGLNRGESNCQLCHPGVALWGALMVARLCSPAVQHPTQWWLAENCPEEELCVKPSRALPAPIRHAEIPSLAITTSGH